MASSKGKSQNFRKHQLRVFQMKSRSDPRVLNRTVTAEYGRQLSARPRDPDEEAAAVFLIDCLLTPEVRTAKVFAIGWHPQCAWAKGPTIDPVAKIFDRFVRGIWEVSVSDNVDGEGQPGWVFTRT